MTETTLIAKQRLEELVSFFGANVSVDADETDDGIELNIGATRISPRLIGHRGETLRSIEYLLSQMVKRIDPEAPRVLVDIAGYKQARKQSLQELAQEVAARVKESGTEEELKPMNPAERRIVHMTLRELGTVDSESRGEGKDRRIVVKPLA
ncbi:MAG TPA: R3H domain-containing nucleic acid-binding protein [Candidatus Saccharimonadia bacterium]|jgi:spoIIIJ-associated protein